MGTDYTTVTEVPGNKITREQLERMYGRYRFASEFCAEKDVLEVACGPGLGLGYLAGKAKRVVGGDYTGNLVNIAKKYYNGRVGILRLDAHGLPFQDSTFDVVIMYEAIYYLAKPEKFISECQRVLRDNGVIIICTVNKDWSDFNPSPFSFKYFSAPELYELLHQRGFGVELFGDCPITTESLAGKVTSAIKRTAVKLHLMPKTMRFKAIFKRIFFGKLLELKNEIEDGVVDYHSPVSIPCDSPNLQYKVLYAVAHL